MNELLQIGEASMKSGVSAKMIRYYEQIDLIKPPVRSDSGYRFYTQSDVHQLQFVHRARDLGFSIEDIRELLRLWHDRKRPSRDVKRLALQHITEMEAQIDRMKSMVQTLKHLAEACDGNSRPHCPILRDLSGNPDRSVATRIAV
jgi:Cu(I)-responsive transcriptional regulator